MASAKTIEGDIDSIRRSAESMGSGRPERIGSPSIGDVVRQGDLYLVCIESCVGTMNAQRQLAPGTTQGSRHVIDGECEIFVSGQLAGVPKELTGPQFFCVGDCTITHPEHGDKILPSGTSWAVVYQRTWADEVRRVQD